MLNLATVPYLCWTHLEHMEGLELNVSALIPQQVHHHLEVCLNRDVLGHDVEVGPVEEDLAEEFKRLAFGYIVRGEQESVVHSKELGEG